MSQNLQNPFFTWIDASKNLMDTWGTWVAQMMPKGEEQPKTDQNNTSVASFYDSFIKNFAQTNPFSFVGGVSQGSNVVEQLYKQWQDNFKNLSVFIPNKAAKDGFDRFVNSYQLMGGLQNYWDTFLKNIPKDATDIEAFSKQALKSYENMMSPFIQPFMLDGLKNYFITSSENIGSMQNMFSEFFKPILENSATAQNQFLKAMTGDKESYQQFLASCKDIYKESFAKILNMPAVGSNRVSVEKMMKLLDYYVDYAVKMNDYTLLISNMFSETMEKLLKYLAELKAEGKQPQTFLEFYKIWSDFNERAFGALFVTDEFTKIMNDAVSASSHFKILFDDVWQDTLSSLPLITKRDFNDVCEEVFNLRKRVKEQEKELKALKEQLTAANAKPAADTPKSKA